MKMPQTWFAGLREGMLKGRLGFVSDQTNPPAFSKKRIGSMLENGPMSAPLRGRGTWQNEEGRCHVHGRLYLTNAAHYKGISGR